MECYTLAARIGKLEVAEVRCNGNPGVPVLGGQSSKGRVVAGDDGANSAEAQLCDTSDEIFKLCAFVEGLNQNVGDERSPVSVLVDARLVRVRSLTTTALCESGSTVS